MIIRLKRFGLKQALEFLDESTQNYIYKCDIYGVIHLYSDTERVGYITTDTFQKLLPRLTCTLTTNVSEFYKSSNALNTEQLEKQSELSNLSKTAAFLKHTATREQTQDVFKEVTRLIQEDAVSSEVIDKVKPLDFPKPLLETPDDIRTIYGTFIENKEN